MMCLGENRNVEAAALNTYESLTPELVKERAWIGEPDQNSLRGERGEYEVCLDL